MRRQGLLSTGQFARLCHTTKETLYHYAELGLLKPCYVGANDYRYYDVQQYLIFDLICSFKDTGASLKEISALLQPLSGKTGLKDQAPAFEMSAFFKRHLADVEKRLKTLTRQKELLKALETVARRGLEVPLNELLLSEEPEFHYELLTGEECGLETRRAMALHSARCLEELTRREFFPPPPLGFVFTAAGLSQIRGKLFAPAGAETLQNRVRTVPSGKVLLYARLGTWEEQTDTLRELETSYTELGLDGDGTILVFDMASYALTRGTERVLFHYVRPLSERQALSSPLKSLKSIT